MTFVDTNRNIGIGLGLLVLDSIFNNISVKSCQSILLVAENCLGTTSKRQTVLDNVVSSTSGIELTT